MRLYAVFYLGSFFLFAILSGKLLKVGRLNGKFLNLFVLVYIIGMIFGAHAFYCLFCKHTLVNDSLQEVYARFSASPDWWCSPSCSDLDVSGFLSATTGGFWGGPLFAILALLPFVLFFRLDLRTKHDLLDVFAVAFPFALAFAKIGCFVTGCCRGIEGEGPLFLRFTWVPKDTQWYMRSLFPTQLLDMLIYFLIGVGLSLLRRKGTQDGKLMLWHYSPAWREPCEVA